jgi:hypothetical protein
VLLALFIVIPVTAAAVFAGFQSVEVADPLMLSTYVEPPPGTGKFWP